MSSRTLVISSYNPRARYSDIPGSMSSGIGTKEVAWARSTGRWPSLREAPAGSAQRWRGGSPGTGDGRSRGRRRCGSVIARGGARRRRDRDRCGRLIQAGRRRLLPSRRRSVRADRPPTPQRGHRGRGRRAPGRRGGRLDRVLAVNVRGVFLGLREAFRQFAAQDSAGAIVVTASICSFGGGAGLVPYHASKHAILGLMRSAAVYGGPVESGERRGSGNRSHGPPGGFRGRDRRGQRQRPAPCSRRCVEPVARTRSPTWWRSS